VRRDPGAEFARAVAFEDAIHDRLSDQTEPFRWGTALFNSQIPAIYDANFLRIERADDDITVEELLTEAERIMEPRGLAHRKVSTADERLGERLAEGFAEAGWRVDRLLFMAHRNEPKRDASVDVDEIVGELHTRAKEGFSRRDPHFQSEEEVRQMSLLAQMVFEVTDKRCFAAYAEGKIASVCELYSDGLTAQIEDVATFEEHRGKGLATAVVLRALHEARAWGHETIFLVADADDWPKDLYEQLGFEGMRRTYQFLRRPQVAT